MKEAKTRLTMGSFEVVLLAVALLGFIAFTVVPGKGDGNYNLNLRVMDWDLTDVILNARVFMDNGTEYVKVSDVNGWANFTGVSGAVTVKVQYYGFWVNGTFSITVSGDTTIPVRCNLYDVTVKVVETQRSAYLVGANVTVFNSTSTPANKMATGIAGSNGLLNFSNLPNGTLTFTQYAGTSYTLVIGNETRQVSNEDLTLTLIANRNGITINTGYYLMVVHNS